MASTDTKQFAKGMGFISPWLIGFTFLLLLPIGMSFYYSLCDWSISEQRPPMFIGLANYAEIMRDGLFWRSLWITLLYSAIAIPAGLAVSLGLALLLNAQIPGQPFFGTIIFLPSLVPLVASAMIWMWLFNAKVGVLTTVLTALHLPSPDWLGDSNWALPSLAFMSLWGVGHTVVIFLAGLQDVPAELYEAAEIDGASPVRRLWHVTIPMISPVIFFNLVMAIIGSFQIFAIPYIMTGGGPARSTYFYTMAVFDNAFRYPGRMGYASALAWIQLLLILALTALAFWSSKKWVHYQGK
jgi:multiple sugar transport system permease protein